MKTDLNEYFDSWKEEKHSRYLSWEHCYSFFQDNKDTISSDEVIREQACLHLAFYLASWGMYRGSSNLLWNDYKIFDELLKELLNNCSDLWKDISKITWSELKSANEIIKKHLIKAKIQPTDTLITKILMGIYGCTPAYDRFFIDGLRKYNNTHKSISTKYNQKSFEKLKTLAEDLKFNQLLKDKNIKYPKMRLIDAYFWYIGGGKNAYSKRAKK